MGETIGYIGLGDIGAPMAERIAKAGYDLIVWNREAAKMKPFTDAGAKAAASPADMAQKADVILTCVTDGPVMAQVLFGPNGVAANGKARATLLIDNSTVHPMETREMAVRLKAEAGMAFVDAPVSGGPVGARAGTLAAMAGGEAADVERARPILMTFSNRVTHMGGVGAGHATKACNQIINFCTMAGIAEAMNLGARFGIDTQSLPEAIAGGFADSNMLREYDRATKAGENASVTWLINTMRQLYSGEINPQARGNLYLLMKDIGIALDLGRKTRTPLPVFGLLDAMFRILETEPVKPQK